MTGLQLGVYHMARPRGFEPLASASGGLNFGIVKKYPKLPISTLIFQLIVIKCNFRVLFLVSLTHIKSF